ncbi:MAG: hypothetical protein KDA79_14255, partial [Planctomycetaceae bacterium]|nr:hypothetical protein [Planctomycetaceae bacterium]
MRQRELFDIADLYLVKIEGQPDTPEDIRVVIPYERALTLLAWSRTQRNPEDQAKMLDQAEAHLEQFTKANPQHPLAGEASTERARMLLDRARNEIWKSRAPANQGNRREFQQNARAMVTKAREIFKAAHDLHKAAYDKYPGFIDQQENRQQFEERRTAEVKYIRAQLDMALCTYELAQTYDEGSEEFRSTLTKASTEFEDIHTKYRSQVGGLYARMWQGKCFEEQDEIGKALGIYNELLEHPGKSDTLRRLQDQVRQFRLICLNHEQRKDYELVRIEAGDWLKDNRRASPIHMGIRWERARALESLGDAKATDQAEALRYYRLARTDAEYLARFDGQYRDVAQAMFQRMEVHLKDDPGDPTTFDQASAMGRSLVKQIKPLKDSVSAEKDPAKKAELQLKYDDHVVEAARMLNLALKLSDEETKITQVNSVRYQLAYVYYLLRESYRAAILGEFVGQHYAVEDSTTAQDSAYIALAAWMQAYNDATKDRSRGEGESAAGAEPPGQTELRRMLRVSELITETWPQSDRANDARMTLGNVYSRLKEPVQAAKWFQQVPATAAQYPDAQEAAGQAYWSAWLEAARLDEASRPAAAELDAWQASARSHLSTAIDQLSKQVPEGGQPSPGLIAAKVSLSQILISQGEYQAAIELLTQDPHSPSKAIQVEEGKPRPRVGVTSRDFASLTYQQLLRAYVGVQQIDPALQVMQKLEELGGGDDGGVMQIYVNLGQELEKEIRRLRELNQTDRLTTVRESFDKFLNELFNRRDQMNYNALVWIAETYNSLGTGMGEDSGATAYFEKAANTYADILTRAEQDPNFTSVSLSGVRLRLVTCRRRQQNFEEALNLVAVILKEKPRALDAQFEAAQ